MSEAREVRSFIGLSISVPGHNSVPGNFTMFFYHNDGMLLHIMGLDLLVHFRTWT